MKEGIRGKEGSGSEVERERKGGQREGMGAVILKEERGWVREECGRGRWRGKGRALCQKRAEKGG